MKKLPKQTKEIIERHNNWIDAVEGLLDTFERFGVSNPGKCGNCDDYGCNGSIDKFIERWEARTDSKTKVIRIMFEYFLQKRNDSK